VSCGAGHDLIRYRDAVDRIDADCEARWEVNIGSPPPPPARVAVFDPAACKRRASARTNSPPIGIRRPRMIPTISRTLLSRRAGDAPITTNPPERAAENSAPASGLS